VKISLRILLGYFFIVGLAAYFVLKVFVDEVKPGVRQAMEETLVDTANILAELAAAELKAGQINQGRFAAAVLAAGERDIDARIWGVNKNSLDFRVYVTDARGTVVFDSDSSDVGKDYSRWNDVLLTLQGRYGVRSSRSDPDDDRSTIMHVAAPIKDGDRIIGALTIAKPNATVQPFVDRSQKTIRDRGLLLLGAAALIGLLFTWRLTRSLNRLRQYARAVAAGEKAPLPESGSSEIAELGRALAAMREKLEGKQYIEQYVHSLTHEIKSPVAAIRGAAELLDENMPPATRSAFLTNIREQCERLALIAERMLHLAEIEQRQSLENPQDIDLRATLQELAISLQSRLDTGRLTLSIDAPEALVVRGDPFLLRQALLNLFDNAIDFAPPQSCIGVRLIRAEDALQLSLRDHGPGIPDYARERIFERFYSLPRPGSGKKSTGLGLPFVREVTALHCGKIELQNHPDGGVEVLLTLPLSAG